MLSSHYKDIQACHICSYIPKLGHIPFLADIVDFTNCTVLYKSWCCSQFLATLLLISKAYPSNIYCYLTTRWYISVMSAPASPDWDIYHFWLTLWIWPTLPSFIKAGAAHSFQPLFYWFLKLTTLTYIVILLQGDTNLSCLLLHPQIETYTIFGWHCEFDQPYPPL